MLLKGSDTIVVDGTRAAVNSTGGVALATAGTGDVLSGVIGALLSRGADPYDAARTGAWAHGRAAELWLKETGRPVESMVATDLFEYLPAAFAELYDRIAPRAYAIAVRICATAPAAQDALQAGFRTMWRSSERYDASEGDVASWVVGLVRERAIESLRRARQQGGDQEHQPHVPAAEHPGHRRQ